jgi:hypothetical protein
VNQPLIRVGPAVDWTIAAVPISPVALYLVARIIDLFRARRSEVRSLASFSSRHSFAGILDPEILAKSVQRRIVDRLNAIIMLGFIVVMIAAITVVR